MRCLAVCERSSHFTEDDTAVLELGLSEYLPGALVETRKRDHEIVENELRWMSLRESPSVVAVRR